MKSLNWKLWSCLLAIIFPLSEAVTDHERDVERRRMRKQLGLYSDFAAAISTGELVEIENMLERRREELVDMYFLGYGLTHLMFAVHMDDNVEIVRKLLYAGWDVNFRAELTGETALIVAAKFKRTETLKELLREQWHVSVNVVDEKGRSALMYSVHCSYKCECEADAENIRLLLTHGADPFQVHEPSGKNALMMSLDANATLAEVKSIVGYVIETGTLEDRRCMIDHQDKDGRTPLMLAAELNRSDLFVYLVKFGEADIKIKDEEGLTAADYLHRQGVKIDDCKSF